MRHFRDLLKPEPNVSPGEQQQHAAAALPDTIAESHMRWWKTREVNVCHGKCLLLGIGSYSQYDLTLLDLMEEFLAEGRSDQVPIYVVNVADYTSREQLAVDFPGLGPGSQSPMAAVWEAGSLKKVASGKMARELVAETLGVVAQDLEAQWIAESPSYGHLAGQT
jgi:hypothetical protein